MIWSHSPPPRWSPPYPERHRRPRGEVRPRDRHRRPPCRRPAVRTDAAHRRRSHIGESIGQASALPIDRHRHGHCTGGTRWVVAVICVALTTTTLSRPFRQTSPSLRRRNSSRLLDTAARQPSNRCSAIRWSRWADLCWSAKGDQLHDPRRRRSKSRCGAIAARGGDRSVFRDITVWVRNHPAGETGSRPLGEAANYVRPKQQVRGVGCVRRPAVTAGVAACPGCRHVHGVGRIGAFVLQHPNIGIRCQPRRSLSLHLRPPLRLRCSWRSKSIAIAIP